eukprot:7673873-Alexandrium_andersonii.AAC.1
MARGARPCGTATSSPLWSRPFTFLRTPTPRQALGGDRLRAACRLHRVTETQEEVPGPDPNPATQEPGTEGR